MTETERIAGLETENERLRELLREVIEPGVFGEWHNVEDPALKKANLSGLCERYGYGAVMSYAAYLWALKDPAGAHTTAACVAVRRSVIKRIKEAATNG